MGLTDQYRSTDDLPGVIPVFPLAGAILLPRGQLPLNIFVTDARRERIATDRVVIDVPVALDNPIGYFQSIKEVTFAIPEGSRAGEFEVFVGFERNIPNSG